MVQTRSHTEGAVFAVHVGRQRGIFTTWAETLKHVKDYQGTIYKKLSSRAEAEQWLDDYATRDAERSSRANVPGIPGKGTGHQPNALGLVIEPSASHERVTSVTAQDASMDVDDSDDDAYAEVRAAEEVLRRAHAKMAAKSKAKAGAAAVSEWEATMQPEASASIKKKDARVKKEEEIVVDVQTWSQVKVEKDTRRDERRYTASEKGKGRDESSQLPATDTSVSAPVSSGPTRHTSDDGTVKPDVKSVPARSMSSVAPTSNAKEAAFVPRSREPGSLTVIATKPASNPNPIKASSANTLTVMSSTSLANNKQAAPDAFIIAYTDGAGPKNQSKENRTPGYGVHWAAGRPAGVPGDISRRCARGHTNNYVELLAIIRVLELTTSDPRPLTILSDSMYSLDCITWSKEWRKAGWKRPGGKEIKNLELIRYMVALLALRESPTVTRHVRAHTSDEPNPNETPDQRGNRIADGLAKAGAKLPETEAETETNEDWAKLRASAEMRVEERLRKQESETVHVDVGSAMGLTQAPAPDVNGATQAVSQMTVAEKKPESATQAGGSAKPRGGKLSRDAIKAVLSRSQIPDETAPTSSTSAAKAPSAEPLGQTPTPVSSQPVSQSASRAPAASVSAPPAATIRTSTAPAPHTPSRTNTRTNGPTSSQGAHAHTTPVATGPAKEAGGKVIVRVYEEADLDKGIWDEEYTLDDEDMIAEALGR